MPISLNTALFSTQNGVMPFEMNFPTFLVSFAIVAALVLVAWFVLSYWDVTGFILHHIVNSNALDSGDHRTRFHTFLDDMRRRMTIEPTAEGSAAEEDHARTAPRPSDFQRVLVGIPLRRPIRDTPRRRSLRMASKQRLAGLFGRERNGDSAPRSVSGDIEMGDMTSQSRRM